MKNKFFKSFMMLVAMMVAGINSVWADGVTDVKSTSYKIPNGCSIYFTCPDGTKDFSLNDIGSYNNQGKISNTYTWLIKFNSDVTVSASQTANAKIQWKDAGNTWHGWYQFFVDGRINIPFPKEGDNCLVLGLDGSGNPTYQWKVYGGSPTPQPDPVGGDPRVDGCDGCFTVQ